MNMTHDYFSIYEKKIPRHKKDTHAKLDSYLLEKKINACSFHNTCSKNNRLPLQKRHTRTTTIQYHNVALYSRRHDAVGRLSRKRPAEAIDKRRCKTQVMLQLHDFSIIWQTLHSHNSKPIVDASVYTTNMRTNCNASVPAGVAAVIQQQLSNFSHDGS